MDDASIESHCQTEGACGGGVVLIGWKNFADHGDFTHLSERRQLERASFPNPKGVRRHLVVEQAGKFGAGAGSHARGRDLSGAMSGM